MTNDKLRRRQRVAVGMSGGVDSSVAAALLVEQRYEVTGVFLECWKEPGCRTDEDRKDALSVALKLKIPFMVLDFKKEYKHKVVDYFYSEYKSGRTPNPDVVCNKEIKFGLFYDWALRRGAPQGKLFDYVATGHYARIEHREESIEKRADGKHLALSPKHCALLRGVDERKDQSYFLYRLRQEQLGQILFPVGHLTKTEVRQEARKRGLPVADKPDSTGICFIGEIDVKELLKKRLGEKRGEVVDIKGRVIGQHDGVWFYTVGQRHGFRVSQKSKVKSQNFNSHAVPPFYVVEKDIKNNRLVVGFGAETYRDQFGVEDCSWLTDYGLLIAEKAVDSSQLAVSCLVRIRHGGQLIPAEIRNPQYQSVRGRQKSEIRVNLSEPQRGVAPGQSAVFYDGEVVLGGGIIQ